jgi:DNA-directed RNA polymerase specialized sigma24 family protein
MRKAELNKPVPGNERAAALAALSDDQRKRLAAYARVMSKGTGDEHDDLLQGACARWMASKKPVEGPEQTESFLLGAMRNLRFNAFRHQKVVRRVAGVRAVAIADDDEDPLEQVPDPTGSPEDALFAQQLCDLCGDDEDLRLLFMAIWANAAPDDIQAELGWDEKKYKAVQKRKIRAVARWKLEGKLT